MMPNPVRLAAHVTCAVLGAFVALYLCLASARPAHAEDAGDGCEASYRAVLAIAQTRYPGFRAVEMTADQRAAFTAYYDALPPKSEDVFEHAYIWTAPGTHGMFVVLVKGEDCVHGSGVMPAAVLADVIGNGV